MAPVLQDDMAWIQTYIVPGENDITPTNKVPHRYQHKETIYDSTTPPGLQLYQQAITMVARMWPEENSTSSPSGSVTSHGWLLGEERLPLVIGAVIGGALLLLALLAAALWRCYNVSTSAKHTYCMKDIREVHPANLPRRESAVCVAGADGQWAYTSHVLMPAVSAPHWFYNSRVIGTLERLDAAVPRSISVPQPATWMNLDSGMTYNNNKHSRPLSQPVVRFMPCEYSLYSACQFTSSGALEEHAIRSRSASAPSAIEESLRTRSLPSWVRSNRSRPYPPLSSAEDLTQLYAQVNLSKKRRNRMRNGEAAIIALSRSRSKCHLLAGTTQTPVLSLPPSKGRSNKDTDTLVDNEAVIVYDERTAV